MAITRHLAELILKEHAFRTIGGNTLLLGRQDVFMTPDEAQAVVAAAGIPIRSGASIAYDQNEFGRARNFISDVSFFSLFSDTTVLACDVSAAERPDFVFDLSGPLPPGLEDRFDFIYNGSVLDNAFDAAACLRNITRMLAATGVVMHYEGVAHDFPAYLRFTPDWFFDYYALNQFEDCQVSLCTFDDIHETPWEVAGWDAFYEEGGHWQQTFLRPLTAQTVVVVVAEKAPGATADRSPVQNLYRRGEHGDYLPAFERYRRSRRRVAGNPLPDRGYRALGRVGVRVTT
jgi:hypothetical protein